MNKSNESSTGETMITKTERAELRSVVRQQMKVLRSEVHQRGSEMLADIDAGIAEKYSEEDANFKALRDAIEMIVREANNSIDDLLTKHGTDQFRYFDPLGFPRFERADDRHRVALRHAAISDVKAKVEMAKLRLDRTEADLLRQLSVDALESDEAKGFLGSIPSVSELVPVARLAELEAALEGPKTPKGYRC